MAEPTKKQHPGFIVGLILVFVLFFGMASLAAWADLLAEFLEASSGLGALVVMATVLFPTGRKNGGCCLGCGLGMAASMGLVAATVCFPHTEQARVLPREALPVPRYVGGAKPSVDGVELGMTPAQVRSVLGPGSISTSVWYTQGLVTAVEGRVLAQRSVSRVLVQAQDSLSRANDVLQPGVVDREIFRREGYTFRLRLEGSRVKTIRMSRE